MASRWLARGRRQVRAGLAPLVRWLKRRWAPTLSQRGEDAAAAHLRRQGLIVVARGLRSRTGELDLVAVDGRTVVFIEVKTRTSLDAGHPAEAVTADKQRRIAREALWFVRRHRLGECPLRFDVVGVLWPRGARRPTLEHLVAAYDPPGHGQLWG